MRLFGSILIGIIISLIIFFVIYPILSEDGGPFIIITALLGIVMGLQIEIYRKIK